MLGLLTLLLVLRISGSSPSALGLWDSSPLSRFSYQSDIMRFGSYLPFQSFHRLPNFTTTTTTTTLSPLQDFLLNFLKRNENFDDADEYKKEEVKEEDYKDYEDYDEDDDDYEDDDYDDDDDDDDEDDDDIEDEPLQPDNEEENYDESTENNTVSSMNENYNNLSDYERANFNNSENSTSSWYPFDSDYVYNRTSWDQFYQNDVENNQTYWDQYNLDDNNGTDWQNNQTDLEYNRNSLDDMTPKNLSVTKESNATESKPFIQFRSTPHPFSGQPIKRVQSFNLDNVPAKAVTRSESVNSDQGQTPIDNKSRKPHPSKKKTKQGHPVPGSKYPVNSHRPESKLNGTKVREKSKVKKCCPMGKGYDIVKGACVNVSDSFDPPVWDGFYLIEEVNATQEFIFNSGLPSCKHKEEMFQATNISKVLYVNRDGNLTVEFPRDRSPSLEYTPQKYCMDNFVNYYNKTEFDAFICHIQTKSYTHTTLSSVCMLVTCFLILLRVILFAWLPELRTLHGMILMAYLISFLVGFMLLSITQLLFELEFIVQEVCTFCSFIIYFSLLSAFFWRNIMCYDIWWTFSCKRAFSSRSFSSRTRFNLYSAYAFGVPMALTVLLGALEFSTLPRLHPLMPKLRLQGCFLYGNSKLLYLYGPIILLFIINVIFSTLTAVKIAAIKKETKTVLQSNESSTHDQQRATQRFSLYLKLFTAMAFLEVNWMLEVVAVFAPDITSLLHVSDIYNVVAPLIIFINFMCQKQTWKIIRKRYRQVKGLPDSGVPTSGTQTTQSQEDTKSQIKQV